MAIVNVLLLVDMLYCFFSVLVLLTHQRIYLINSKNFNGSKWTENKELSKLGTGLCHYVYWDLKTQGNTD